MKRTLTEDELEDIKRRYHAAYRNIQRFIDILIRVTQYSTPMADGLNVLYGFNNTGKNLNINIFNPTAKGASIRRAKKLHSLLLPVNKHWCSIYTKDEKTGELRMDTENTDKVFNLIDASNLHESINSFFLDLNVGCAALWVDSPSKKNPVIFKNIPGMTLMPELSGNPNSKDVWFRKVVSWHDLHAINPAYANNQPKDNDEYFITCGYLDLSETDHKGYLLIQYHDTNFTEALSTQWFDYNRLILVNDIKRSGEARGHGIAMQYLEEIEYLNVVTEALRKTVEYNADPMLIKDNNIPDELMQLKGATISSDFGADGRSPIVPVVWKTDINATAQIIKDSEGKINAAFEIMPFGRPEESPVTTATEIRYRASEEERQTISDVSRMAIPLLVGIIEVVVNVARERELIEISDKQELDFQFDSPAVSVQKSDNMDALIKATEEITQIVGPGAVQINMKPRETSKYIFEQNNIPNSLIATDEQYNSSLKKLTNQMQQQQQQGKSKEQPQGQPQAPGDAQPSALALGGPGQLQPAEPVQTSQLGQEIQVSGVGQ